MINTIASFLLWFFVWLVLSWPPDANDLALAVMASLIVTFITANTFRRPRGVKDTGHRPGVKRLFWFICYVPVFIWECVKANLDVAFRVVHPGLPIRPGTVRVKTELVTDMALTFLANSITLTPGTTTVDVDKENGFIYIHRLYIADDQQAVGGNFKTVERFEKMLKRIFE